jgi:hypothetical protein
LLFLRLLDLQERFELELLDEFELEFELELLELFELELLEEFELEFELELPAEATTGIATAATPQAPSVAA